jgi:G:T-mismatch repair DNA endonuclease (very short patch repair protein)
MKCEICGDETTIRSMAMHLKWSHSMTTEQYVNHHGEFRPKQIHNNHKISQSDVKCQICNENLMHNRQLMYHITTKHKDITKEEYIVKYILNGVIPTCVCGCGEPVTILPWGKTENGKEQYHTDYIKGHFDWVKPGWISHTHETKMKMRESRIEYMKTNGDFYQKDSAPENDIFNFINQHFPSERNNRNILSGKELDIVIPSKNIAIEFNGMHFHSTLFKEKQYHINKTKECELNGYRLIHIWECDWKLKRNIIESNLLNIIGKTPNKIFARKCIIKEVPRKIASEFLNINHLQGYALDKIRIGLYHDNELVSLMTFSKTRKNLGGTSKDGEYELLRFCNKLNTTVVGGASRMLKYFINHHTPLKITSYANRDWSQGNLYTQIGFNFIGYTTPGYFYSKSRIRYNRFGFRKDILVRDGYDPNKTESQIMEERGFHKIWDTGNLKFEMIF